MKQVYAKIIHFPIKKRPGKLVENLSSYQQQERELEKESKKIKKMGNNVGKLAETFLKECFEMQLRRVWVNQ